MFQALWISIMLFAEITRVNEPERKVETARQIVFD